MRIKTYDITIVWTPNALSQFENAISFIKADSEINAEKFEKVILEKLNELLIQPERYLLINLKILIMAVSLPLKVLNTAYHISIY